MDAPVNLFTDGKAYERLMGRWSQIAGAEFLDWLEPPKNLNWIDVGCGNGAFTEVLLARAAPAAVTGIDPSDGQIDYARSRPGAKRAQFRVGDAQALPFADNSFDAASMALVIMFLSDPLKAAREMARVVKPGGLVASYMWDFHNGGFPFYPVGAAMKAAGLTLPSSPNPDASRQEAMRAYWQQAGLQSIDTRVIRIRTSYASFEEFWENCSLPIGTYGTALAALPESGRDKVKARLRQELPNAADGSVGYDAFANAVKGRVPA